MNSVMIISSAGVQAAGRGFIVIMACLTAGITTNLRAQTTATNLQPPTAQNEGPATYKKMSLQELMALDVTSVSKSAEPYADAPAAIQVITGDDIRRSGATLIPEALRLADNLEVAQLTSSSWDISARGFNSSVGDKLLVLIDGRSVYTPLFSGVIWNMQDYLLEDIDRIEVISGPGGTLWGANAVNGVINILSKNAKDTQGLYLEAGGGTQTQDFTGVRYGGQIASNVYYRVYGKYFDEGAEVFSDGKSADDPWNRAQGGFRIDADRSPQDQLTLQGDLYVGDTDTVPGGEGTQQAEGTTSGANMLGRWTHTFSDTSDLSLQVYYDYTHIAAPFQADAALDEPEGLLRDDLDTYDVDFQDRFELGERNRIIWGLGYRFTHDVVSNAPVVGFTPGTLDQNLFSGFAQDQIKLIDKVYLTLGSKLEHNDFTGFEYEPSGRLQWNMTDHQMVWAAISRAVRTPSRYDRDLEEPAPPAAPFLGSNSTFESETVLAYELGYRAQVSQKVSGSLSLFYNDYDHLRSLDYTPKTLVPFYFQNDLEGDTYGFEFSANYQVLDWWRLHGGYDLLKEDIHVRPGGVDLDDALNETADPQQQVFLRSSMDLPYRLELDISSRWVDRVHNSDGPTPGEVPAYADVDVRIGWRATSHMEFSIVGENLLHNYHAEAGFPGAAQEEIARAVYGKVSFLW
jgi:iron complex outermembrane receptor protein